MKSLISFAVAAAALCAAVPASAQFAKAATEDAEIVHAMAQLPWAGFGAGTEGGKAKPEIWKEQAKFKEHSDKLQAESVKLVAAAKTGNLDTLKASFGATAGTCKACHDNYRAK